MIKQFQTKTQQIAMFIVLLALVIVIAKKVYAGTHTESRDEITQCDKNASAEIKDMTLVVRDLPWGSFFAFLIWR